MTKGSWADNMKSPVYVHPELVETVTDIVEANGIGIDIAITAGESAKISIEPSPARAQCSLEKIYAGGWIDCQLAHRMAAELAISIEQMGKLLNGLDVKVRNCGLGCF